MINVELTEEEAVSFIAWRKHQDCFETLLRAGVFNTKKGKALLHFDLEGLLMLITFPDYEAWKR